MGKTVSLHAPPVVRDDQLALYGFARRGGARPVPDAARGAGGRAQGGAGGAQRRLAARAAAARWPPATPRASRPSRASASAPPSGSSSSCARRWSSPRRRPPSPSRAATIPRLLARDGLVGAGLLGPGGAGAARGRGRPRLDSAEELIALRCGRRGDERGAHPDARRPGRGRVRARPAPARGWRTSSVRRQSRRSWRSRSRPRPLAATRSTTCCWPGLRAWARLRWPRSWPPSWRRRSCRPRARRWSARATWPRTSRALEPRSVFFVDEVHRLPRAVEETFYPAMEDRRLPITVGQGAGARVITLELPPFTLIAATTRAGLLTTPLRDRFGIQHRLDHYGDSDLARDRAPFGGDPGGDDRRRRRRGDRPAQPRHPARGQPPAQAGARLRPGAGGRGDRRGDRQRRAGPAGGGLGGARSPGPPDPARGVREASPAGRWGCPPWPWRWARSRTRSPTSTSPTCSSAAFWPRTPRGRAATARAWEHLGLEVPSAARLF